MIDSLNWAVLYAEEQCDYCNRELFSFLPPMINGENKYCCLECMNDDLCDDKVK